MRNVLFIALMVPALALAVGVTQPMTVLPADNGAGTPVQQAGDSRQNGKAVMPLLGTLDTVGGTSYDWWANGPAYRFIVNSTDYGVHVLWMYSAEMSGTAFTDRNMRYNFLDYAVGGWNWIDPDFMQSGQNVFPYRVGYGSLDADPMTSVALVSCHSTHGGLTIHPDAARDIAPGAGIFEYAEGDPTVTGYQWPPLGVSSSGTIHFFPITNAYLLAYTKIATWPNFEAPVNQFPPDPGFPTHNIATSKVSQKVCLTWEDSNTDLFSYYAISEDDGVNWVGPTQLAPPVAYGGDTVSTFHISSLFPFYDRNDQLHFVSLIGPTVHDTGYVIPAEIWHWTNDVWTKIHRAACDPANLQAQVGYNVLYAGRPSIGEDQSGNLYVAWEQFDSANVEPTTSFLRADIFGAASEDGGATWLPAVKLTEAGTNSCRFPSIIDYVTDQVRVVFEVDQVAGFYVQSQGAATTNAVVVSNTLPADWGVGIAEGPNVVPAKTELSVTPNPVTNRALVSYALPRAGEVSLVVYDASGRPVQTLASGRHAAGRYTATLDASSMAAGVYFYTLSSGKNTVSAKLTVTH